MAVVMIEDIRTEFLEQIRTTFSPTYKPFITTHSDPWVWATPSPSLLDRLLLTDTLPGRTKYKLGLSSKPSGELYIKSVCYFCNNGNPQLVEHSLAEPNHDFFRDYFRNLNGKLLRISFPAIQWIIEIDPRVSVNNAKRGKWKPLFDDFLVKSFNFTYYMFLTTGKGSGKQFPNGTWTGVVGDLLYGKADVGIATANAPDRIHHITFTNSFFDKNELSIFTTSGVRIFSPLALLWSFDTLSWMFIGIATVIVILTFSFISWFYGYHFDVKEPGGLVIAKEEKNIPLTNHTFFVLTSYLNQASAIPKFAAFRCFVAFWLFFTLIITTIYRSKMVGFLAFPLYESLPQTYRDLAYSNFTLGFVMEGDSALNTFKASRDHVYVKLIKKMEIIPLNALNCVERILKRAGYACISYTQSMEYVKTKNLSCSESRKLIRAKETTYSIFVGLALTGGSIYKEGFDRMIARTRSFHLPEVWKVFNLYHNVYLPKRAWWLETNNSEKLRQTSKADENDDLTLRHISGAFYVLAGCLALCLVFFTMEVITYWLKAYKVTKMNHAAPVSKIVTPCPI
ncbi:glutamate receptor ionotropic, delta-2 [Folsomia candida]|uniref:glutamate receptor ionotropic, delta-2 n=1 Tax=Folsomia candida TaxID=158441 RepID=UPI001604E338|nr:glutamate receptor ionotropic, delta-2 [Folsomia candida]